MERERPKPLISFPFQSSMMLAMMRWGGEIDFSKRWLIQSAQLVNNSAEKNRHAFVWWLEHWHARTTGKDIHSYNWRCIFISCLYVLSDAVMNKGTRLFVCNRCWWKWKCHWRIFFSYSLSCVIRDLRCIITTAMSSGSSSSTSLINIECSMGQTTVGRERAGEKTIAVLPSRLFV